MFGYKPVSEFDSVKRESHGQPVSIAARLEIEPEAAQVVRRMFESYAHGKSPRAIAEALNADAIAPPGAHWKRREDSRHTPAWLASAISGNAKLGTGILRNPTYRGVLTWNQSQWLRDPDTKRRVYRLRDPSEHIERAAPQLRIVSDKQWSAAQVRLASVRAAGDHIRAALHANARTGRQPKSLLSGLLVCGQRGSRFIMSGTGRSQAYACSTRVNGGKSACENTFRVPRELAEVRLLEGIREALLEPKRVAQFEREVRKALREEQAAQRNGDKDRAARLAKLD